MITNIGPEIIIKALAKMIVMLGNVIMKLYQWMSNCAIVAAVAAFLNFFCKN